MSIDTKTQRLQELTSIAPTVSIRLDMEWLASTENTADFLIRLTNTNTATVKFNALIIRGVHSPNITTGTITWKALNNNIDRSWLGWPRVTANLPYISGQRKLNFSSATNIFTNETAPTIPAGAGVEVGIFRISTSTAWNPNSNFGFTWEMTTGGVIAYLVPAKPSSTSALAIGIMHYGPITSTTLGKCLTVQASSEQTLNKKP